MESFGIIVVGPLWGLISAQLFFQTGEEFIKAWIYLMGFLRHKVSSKKLLPRIVISLTTSVLCAILLVFGFWLICIRYPSLRTPAQNVLYLAFAILSAAYIVSQMPAKIRKAWRHANVPGAIEDDAQIDAEDEAERKEIDTRDPANRNPKPKKPADTEAPKE
jgi:hypothetical protein